MLSFVSDAAVRPPLDNRSGASRAAITYHVLPRSTPYAPQHESAIVELQHEELEKLAQANASEDDAPRLIGEAGEANEKMQGMMSTINEGFCEAWKAAGFAFEPTAVGKVRFEVDFAKGGGGGDDDDDEDEVAGQPLDPMQMLDAIRALKEALERYFRPVRKLAPVRPNPTKPNPTRPPPAAPAPAPAPVLCSRPARRRSAVMRVCVLGLHYAPV
jgi:hypothetical protein